MITPESNLFLNSVLSSLSIARSISSAVSNSTTPVAPSRSLMTSVNKGGAAVLKWSFKSCQEAVCGNPLTITLYPVLGGLKSRLRSLPSLKSSLKSLLLSRLPRASSTRSLAPIRSTPSLPRTASSASLHHRFLLHFTSSTSSSRST